MAENKYSISRRNFFKTAGAVGVGSLLSPFESLTAAQAKSDLNELPSKVVPTRPFGKTGVDVPILGLGHAFACSSNLLLKQSLNMGVRLWDTAATYAGGNEEKGIGKYFAKFPEDRKKVFLVTKSRYRNSDYWSTDLDRSLERMNTSYIDLFLVRAVSYAKDLTPPLNNAELWAEKAKSEGKIRFFGFSTHRIIEENSMQASKFGWIDGIMFSYNFRNMHSENMNKAIDACAKAGIGLIAMKTQASGWLKEKEEALFNQLAKKGLTIEQAKLKAVWDDQRIAGITSAMTNMTILLANVAAALNNQKLSLRDKQLLDQYARQTASSYCAGCASICESEINSEVPISDIMRFLMYARCYGELANAKSHFNELPLNVRKQMAHIDYKRAEHKCPQRMKIGRLMREAAAELV
jgi:predicted aldo/keto reductase-like oxidoreductase